MGPGGAGQLWAALGAVFEQVREAELRGHRDGLRDPVPRRHLEEGYLGGEVYERSTQIVGRHAVVSLSRPKVRRWRKYPTHTIG